MARGNEQPLALTHGSSTSDDLIDALPYLDPLTPEMKREVEGLIEAEMRASTKRPADYLREMPPLPPAKFEGHPLLQAEYERCAAESTRALLDALRKPCDAQRHTQQLTTTTRNNQNKNSVRARQPMPPLDVTRFRLDPPPAAQRSDPNAWRKAADNACAQLEHQLNRIANLELLLKFGPNAWRAQAQLSGAAAKQLEARVTDLHKRVDALNRERKVQQMAAGAELRKLEDEWASAVRKNLEISLACERLEAEVRMLAAQVPADSLPADFPDDLRPGGQQQQQQQQGGGGGDGMANGQHAASEQQQQPMEE
jgi:pre-mRNA-splicing factor SPF27